MENLKWYERINIQEFVCRLEPDPRGAINGFSHWGGHQRGYTWRDQRGAKSAIDSLEIPLT